MSNRRAASPSRRIAMKTASVLLVAYVGYLLGKSDGERTA